MPVRRRVRPGVYLMFFAGFGCLVLLSHLPFLRLPYFWDELGQFIPAALDLYRESAWVPRSAVPNVHPPGLMAYLAGFWLLTGHSIAATRLAMLLLAACALLAAFLLAIELGRRTKGTPAFLAVTLLFASPLFVAQALLAQLDMPAMLLTSAALLLFLQERHRAAALASIPLVLVKETAALAPLLFLLWLAGEKRFREASWFLLPLAALGAWLIVLARTTGHVFGNPEFTEYNAFYLLHPVRFPLALARRLYTILFGDFHWIGVLAVLAALREGAFRERAWRVSFTLLAGYVLMLSLLGGAVLERYLLPVLPVVYAAMAIAISTLRRPLRRAAGVLLIAGLLAGNFWNPPYPCPLENNLAFTDFVRLQQAAAGYLERAHAGSTVTTAWPLAAALRRPEFGYVSRPFHVRRLMDFSARAVAALHPAEVQVFVLYSRDAEPTWSLLRLPFLREIRRRVYGFERPVTGEELRQRFRLRQEMRWERRGQWVEIYVKDRQSVPGSSIEARAVSPPAGASARL